MLNNSCQIYWYVNVCKIDPTDRHHHFLTRNFFWRKNDTKRCHDVSGEGVRKRVRKMVSERVCVCACVCACVCLCVKEREGKREREREAKVMHTNKFKRSFFGQPLKNCCTAVVVLDSRDRSGRSSGSKAWAQAWKPGPKSSAWNK